jgi:hypothetical protein
VGPSISSSQKSAPIRSLSGNSLSTHSTGPVGTRGFKKENKMKLLDMDEIEAVTEIQRKAEYEAKHEKECMIPLF